MFDAAGNSQTRVGHSAPVENLQGRHYAKGETKANIIFVLSSPFPVQALSQPAPGL
jgi:hypothetical protein